MEGRGRNMIAEGEDDDVDGLEMTIDGNGDLVEIWRRGDLDLSENEDEGEATKRKEG
jgi:hypothetical protein